VSALAGRGLSFKEQIDELRKALADLKGEVVALQARVFVPEKIVSPGPSEEVLEALRAKREADLEEMEKAVDVEVSDWESRWLTR
jgi:hypothetical protein